MRMLALVLTLLTAGAAAHAADPALALRDAKQQIAQKQYAAAAARLEPAFDGAAAISDAATRDQAMAALHFYSAVGHAGAGNAGAARSHLDEFFLFSPNARIDPSRYDGRFVKLFNAAAAEARSSGEFRALYGNFRSFHEPGIESATPALVSALEVLATQQEKREWQSVGSEEERERFLSSFWERRDPSPGTAANEFRDSFTRRVAFADEVFAAPGEHGAMTDRGRVFLVLGEPAHIQRRALKSTDAIMAMNVGSVGIQVGTIEYWFYTREQVPASPKNTLTFRFVSHQGIGHYVLQKDGVSMNALAKTAKAAVRE